jgi:hypothetical protein
MRVHNYNTLSHALAYTRPPAGLGELQVCEYEMSDCGTFVCRGQLGNRKAVPCDFVCEGIFASAVSEEIRKPTLQFGFPTNDVLTQVLEKDER